MPALLRSALAIALLAIALFVAVAEPASACLTFYDPHRTSRWERLVDWSPPLAPATPTVEMKRGIGPRPMDQPNAFYSTSCDDVGALVLTFPPRPGGEVVGYAFEVLAGRAPDGLLPDGPLRPLPRRGTDARRITLSWTDGATDRQEPLSFVLGIRTVDRAGNRSRTATTLLVRDPGR